MTKPDSVSRAVGTAGWINSVKWLSVIGCLSISGLSFWDWQDGNSQVAVLSDVAAPLLAAGVVWALLSWFETTISLLVAFASGELSARTAAPADNGSEPGSGDSS